MNNDRSNELWKSFLNSGSVDDYLKYKSERETDLQGEKENESKDTGYSSKWNHSLSNGSWRG